MGPRKCIFIGGTGRSGTTNLKRALLKAEGFVGIRPELRIVTDPTGLLDLLRVMTRDWDPYRADYAIARFLELCSAAGTRYKFARIRQFAWTHVDRVPPRYRRHSLESEFGRESYWGARDELLKGLVTEISKANWVGSLTRFQKRKFFETRPLGWLEFSHIANRWIDRLYSEVSVDQESQVIVDDTPFNVMCAADLLHTFPGARLVHICRDPRDVVYSYQKMPWGGSLESAARRVKGILKWSRSAIADLPDSRVFELRLEDLVAGDGSELERLIQSVDCDSRLAKSVLADFSPSKAHVGRWVTELSKDERRWLDDELAEEVNWYGYS